MKINSIAADADGVRERRIAISATHGCSSGGTAWLVI